MKKIFYISLFATLSFLASGVVFAQNTNEKSRLDLGLNNKKLNLPNSNGALLLKSNIPASIGNIPRPSYTQFYRDLLIINNYKNTTNKQLTSIPSESQVDNLAANEKLVVSNIFPNPANNYAQVEYRVVGNFGSANLSFFNLIGKQVADFDLPKSTDKIRINTSNWENGIYGYSIMVDGKVIATKKLLIVHN